MRIYLETKRLYLTYMELSDGAYMDDLDSDPLVLRYLTDKHRCKAEYDRIMVRMQDYYQQSKGQWGYFNLFTKADVTYLGWIHIRPEFEHPEDESLLELGYRTKQCAWGNGYATEASQAVINHIFTVEGVKTVSALAYETNTASTHVMEKCGMHFDGYVKEDGEELVRYLLHKEEWLSRKANK